MESTASEIPPCHTNICSLLPPEYLSSRKFWEKSLHLLLPTPPSPCSVTSLSSLDKGANSHKHSSCQSLTTILSRSWARCSHHLGSGRTPGLSVPAEQCQKRHKYSKNWTEVTHGQKMGCQQQKASLTSPELAAAHCSQHSSSCWRQKPRYVQS